VASSAQTVHAWKARFAIACVACALGLHACQLDTSPGEVKPAEAVDASAPITLQPGPTLDAGVQPVSPPPVDAGSSSGGKTGVAGTKTDAGAAHDAAIPEPKPKDAGAAVDAGDPDGTHTNKPSTTPNKTKDAGMPPPEAGPCGVCPDAKPHCAKADHICVACEAHSDCKQPSAPRCEPTTRACVKCLTAADCGGDAPVCDQSSHACVECATAMDCAGAGAHCDSASHRCVECVADGDCTDPARARCDRGQCAPCNANPQCTHVAGKGVCAIANGPRGGTCVECAADGDCKSTAKPECNDNRCATCTDDGACAGRMGTTVCDSGGDSGNGKRGRRRGSPPTGACVECTAQEQQTCGERVCDAIAKQCTQRARQSAALCQPCVGDRECASGRMCATLDASNASAASYCVSESASDNCLRACSLGAPIGCALDP
jgi:hypothetical protein